MSHEQLTALHGYRIGQEVTMLSDPYGLQTLVIVGMGKGGADFAVNRYSLPIHGICWQSIKKRDLAQGAHK